MATPRSGRNGRSPPNGADGHVDRVAAGLGGEGRQGRPKNVVATHGRIEPEHRDLLLDLAVAAQDGRAGPAADARDDVARLALGELAERVVGERVVEVGEHEVLPDEQAELVAQVVELGRLVGAGPRQAQHVHPGIADGLEGRAKVGGRGREPDDVGRGPERATSEDPHAVDVEVQAIALEVVGRRRPGRERPEPDPAGLDVDRPRPRPDPQADIVERRFAVRVRPPATDRRDTQGATERESVPLGRDRERRVVPAGRSVELDARSTPARHR